MEKIFEKLVYKLKRKYTLEKIGLWEQLIKGNTRTYSREKFTMDIFDDAIKDLFNNKNL